MKTTLLSLGALALLLASCDTSTKDSYRIIPYAEYNLIVNNSDQAQAAQATEGRYEVKFNITSNCVDIKASDLILNNQKFSFETDTMGVRQKFFSIDGTSTYYLTFSKRGSTGMGSSASDLTGSFVYCYLPQTSDILNPSFNVGVTERLDLSYTLSDRYKVQTFWPSAYYQGQSVASSQGNSYSTKASGYLTQINFEKKTASVYVYNADFTGEKENALPKVMRFEDIPVVFTHEGFSLESSAPKTMVLGVKDGRTALVDSVGFAATDFRLDLTSADMTDVMISYKLRDHQVNFRGCSILK